MNTIRTYSILIQHKHARNRCKNCDLTSSIRKEFAVLLYNTTWFATEKACRLTTVPQYQLVTAIKISRKQLSLIRRDSGLLTFVCTSIFAALNWEHGPKILSFYSLATTFRHLLSYISHMGKWTGASTLVPQTLVCKDHKSVEEK